MAYGDVPDFVLLGGLDPDLLCSSASRHHEGTTDVDIQVDLEIQGGSEFEYGSGGAALSLFELR